jgi:outer membrane receptor protein involved in Fe transport
MESNALPTEFVNCTGLRMCLANGGAPVRWVQNTNAPVDAKDDVQEFALEFDVPLLKDLPGVQELSTNLAGRYSDYSTFGGVESWKAGLNWRIVESLRVRGTLSSDIRAPNLNDSYQPAGVSSTGFVDLLTGGNNSLRLVSRGNPDLVPEEARTLTVGAVFTPSFIPRFTVALDYYRTRIENAITGVSYANTAIQNICLASGPTFDSPFCSLAIRPITDPSDPNYRNPNVNFPSEILNSPLNAAQLKLHGYDMQLDYSWDAFGGQFSARHLVSYQPENETINIPGALTTWAVQPELLQSTFLTFRKEGWTAALQNRWLGGVDLATSSNALNGNTQNYEVPRLPSYNVLDTTLSKEFEIHDGKMEAFLTVNNVFNARAPLYGSNSGLPGLFYPTLGFYDDMGRFYTAGFKVKF